MEVPVITTSLLPPLKLSAFMFMFLGNSFSLYSASTTFDENQTDKRALLSFKSLITEDPLGVLNSWNDSSHFCHWAGVRCSSKSRRVSALNLSSHQLVGTISPYVGNISFLEILDLSVNSFSGEIPLGLGNLRRLSMLDVGYNSLRGKIPGNLSNCSQLRYLALNHNNLTGNVPHELGSLSELTSLFIDDNSLYGTIPSSFGNLTSLHVSILTYNSLCGELPVTLSQLKYLKVLAVSANYLSGEFHPSLYNMSSLEVLSISSNNFTGGLRNDIGFAFPNLKTLWLGNNSFTGYIPDSLPNASKLESTDLTFNKFIGKVPLNLGSLKYLIDFDIGFNNLGRGEPGDLDFITSLTNCSNLNTLEVNHNMFGGTLPISIANLSSKLTSLWLDHNCIHGNILKEISNLKSLTTLTMNSNYLAGTIPESIGMLQNLAYLLLDSNQLTGTIPSGIGNLSQLMWLYLWNNTLEGEIPSSLASCRKIIQILLSQNNLSGMVPHELTSFSSLLFMNLSLNSLTGPISRNVGNLSSLVVIDLSYNQFSGEIPNSIGNCLDLSSISLTGNQFDGNIPESLALLEGLSYVDLSNNNISGNIPIILLNLSSLMYLNLSFNNLEGEVPSTGIFSNIIAVDVHGNPSLCGGIPEFHLPACYKERSPDTKRRLKFVRLILIIVLPTSFVALSLLLLVIYLLRNKLKKPSSLSSSSRSFNFYSKISYRELADATSGFSSENLIGSGSFGAVYKAALTADGELVAVKVLKLERKGASKSFMAECEALKNIRHYNLVKVITACSSIDFQGNEFKALVYQFMSNGNLNSWLHPEEGENGVKSLDILQRIGIALDVASALVYLHHQCETPVIHCDLKPHNILLDDDMVAHVGDFGLARLIPNLKMIENGNQFSSLGIKGTIGYAAPEYGMGAPVSILGDVYSFGIVLLEIITGKRPTDSFLQEKDLKLQEYVEMALREQDIEVFDNTSLCEELTREAETWSEGWDYLTDEHIECLISILRIGVTCSAESPKNRMSMSQVYQELLVIRDTFLPKRTNRRS